MARTDEHTKKFMADIAGTPEQDEPKATSILEPIRTARFASKVLTNPKKALSKLLIAKATKSLSSDGTVKESSVNIITLFGFLNDHYDRSWWDWEPETLWKMLRDDHFEEGTPQEIKEAIMALQVLVRTNAPFEEWHIFEKVGHAFNSNIVAFSVLQPLEPQEAAFTMAVMIKVRPKQMFEPEVLGYIAACAREAGMVYLPEAMFPGVQPYLESLNFDIKLQESVKNLYDKNTGISNTLSLAERVQLERLEEVKEYLRKGGVGA